MLKNIGIIINTDKDKDDSILNNLKKIIQDVFVDCNLIIMKDSIIKDEDELKKIDFIISVGGDGTILRTAKNIGQYEIPVLGINIGNLGFVTSIELSESERALIAIRDNNHYIEERILIKCEVKKNGVINEYIALNDAVVAKGTLSRIVEYDVTINDIPYSKFKADGVIIATPTGSTAYSLSAGGPVLFPNLNLFTITPICPHLYGMRTLVVDSSSHIDIRVKNNLEKVYFTIDGQESIQIDEEDLLTIKKYEKKFKLIRLSDYNYLNVLNEKIINK
ncbi:MAG: NAD(+)/NADH kinase [Clostridiaceae bacterium]